jgi:hypothetical protein
MSSLASSDWLPPLAAGAGCAGAGFGRFAGALGWAPPEEGA